MKKTKQENKKSSMVIDLGEEITLNRWQIIQIMFIMLALGAGLTFLNSNLGLLVLGTAILILALPLINKVIGIKQND